MRYKLPIKQKFHICLYIQKGKGGSEEEEEDRLLEKDAAVVPSGLPTGHRVNLEFFKL